MEREESDPGHMAGASASSFAETVRGIKQDLLRSDTSERRRGEAGLTWRVIRPGCRLDEASASLCHRRLQCALLPRVVSVAWKCLSL